MPANSSERQRRRAKDVTIRSIVTIPNSPTCRIIGCGNPTRAAASAGLNRLYCRRHEDHFQRHGSYVRGSLSFTEVAPLRATALAWIERSRDLPRVALALRAITTVLGNAGAPIEAFRLRGLSPSERARASLARVRVAGTQPEAIFAACLAVELATFHDTKAARATEYKEVQVAKLIHRMASGTHRRWERERPNGTVEVTEMHRYPASRGRVLRHLGQAIRQAAELVVEHHLDDLLAFKTARDEARAMN